MRRALLAFSLVLSASPALARQVDMTDAEKAEVAAAIRAEGLNCPAAKQAYAEGPSARGNVLRIHCGPADQDGVFGDFSFRMIFAPSGDVIFEPYD